MRNKLENFRDLNFEEVFGMEASNDTSLIKTGVVVDPFKMHRCVYTHEAAYYIMFVMLKAQAQVRSLLESALAHIRSCLPQVDSAASEA